jgi:hypothetical protein
MKFVTTIIFLAIAVLSTSCNHIRNVSVLPTNPMYSEVTNIDSPDGVDHLRVLIKVDF